MFGWPCVPTHPGCGMASTRYPEDAAFLGLMAGDRTGVDQAQMLCKRLVVTTVFTNTSQILSSRSYLYFILFAIIDLLPGSIPRSAVYPSAAVYYSSSTAKSATAKEWAEDLPPSLTLGGAKPITGCVLPAGQVITRDRRFDAPKVKNCPG